MLIRSLLNVFTALLFVSAIAPFVWQIIKAVVVRLIAAASSKLPSVVQTQLTKWIAFASVLLDIALAAIVLAVYHEFSLPALIACTIIVFVVSRTVYDHIIGRFFPGKGAV